MVVLSALHPSYTQTKLAFLWLLQGDSFIVAFHTPWDALRYCLAVQSELLTLPWPRELLEAPEAADDASEVQLQYSSSAMDWCDQEEGA